MSNQTTRLNSLTSLRFFAALLVLSVHSQSIAHVPLLDYFAQWGATGVGFFFVLSGFVLTWSWQPNTTIHQFYRRRFARIFPLHAVTWAIAVAIIYFFHEPLSLTSFAASLFLIQAWIPNRHVYFAANSVSWSLSDEAFFYALFPLLVKIVRGVRPIMTVTVATVFCIGLSVLTRHSSLWPLYINPAYRLIEFICGIVLAKAVRSGWKISINPYYAMALAVSGYVFVAGADHFIVMAGLPAVMTWPLADSIMLPLWALLIVTFAQADYLFGGSAISKGLIVQFGQWSFALYMTHQLFFRMISKVIGPIQLAQIDLSHFLGFIEIVFFSIIAIGISAIFYFFIERPAERYLRGEPKQPAPIEAEATVA